MTKRELLDITESFDNVIIVETSVYQHVWSENGVIKSRTGELWNRQFRGNARLGLIEYIEEEQSRGRTVYIYGEPIKMYDPNDFSQVLNFRMNSYDGIMKEETEEIETIVKDNKYRYLLIA